jgi:hypothetical protein
VHTGMLAKWYCWHRLKSYRLNKFSILSTGLKCSLWLYLTHICTCLLQIVWLFLGCKWVTCPLYFNITVTLYSCNHQYCITVFKVIFPFPEYFLFKCVLNLFQIQWCAKLLWLSNVCCWCTTRTAEAEAIVGR